MPSSIRSTILGALRSATPFEIPLQVLVQCLTSNPELIGHRAEHIAVAESDIKDSLLGGLPIPRARMPAALPVLGNVAEAVIESILVAHAWQPVYDDDTGISFGHGVDLLMLDPGLARVVAIEVKSTIQPARWPRLTTGPNEQLTPGWFNSPGNQGMVEWDLAAVDIFAMVAQVHLRRRVWRSCLIGGAGKPLPVTHTELLSDLAWLT